MESVIDFYKFDGNVRARVSVPYAKNDNLSVETARLMLVACQYAANRNGNFFCYINNFSGSFTQHKKIVELAKWMFSKNGLSHNFVYQSKMNSGHYGFYVRKLLEHGMAYPVAPEEKISLSSNSRGYYRDHDPEFCTRYYSSNPNTSIYLKVPDGNFSFADCLSDRRVYQHQTVPDLLINYSDRIPSSVFSNAVDDYQRNITHVFANRTPEDEKVALYSSMIVSMLSMTELPSNRKTYPFPPSYAMIEPFTMPNGKKLFGGEATNGAVINEIGHFYIKRFGHQMVQFQSDCELDPRYLNFYMEMGFPVQGVTDFLLESCSTLNDKPAPTDMDLDNISSVNKFDFSVSKIYSHSSKHYQEIPVENKISEGYKFVAGDFKKPGCWQLYTNFVRKFQGYFKTHSDPAVYFVNFVAPPEIHPKSISSDERVLVAANAYLQVVNDSDLVSRSYGIDYFVESCESERITLHDVTSALLKMLIGKSPVIFEIDDVIDFLGMEECQRRVKFVIEKIEGKPEDLFHGN